MRCAGPWSGRRKRHQPRLEWAIIGGGSYGSATQWMSEQQCVAVPCIPSSGYPGALSCAGGQPHAQVVHRSGCRVDRTQPERAVVLACKAKQRLVGAPDRAEDVEYRPQATWLGILEVRGLQVCREQPRRRRGGPKCAEDAE